MRKTCDFPLFSIIRETSRSFAHSLQIRGLTRAGIYSTSSAWIPCAPDNTEIIRFPQNCRACFAQIEFLLIKTTGYRSLVYILPLFFSLSLSLTLLPLSSHLPHFVRCSSGFLSFSAFASPALFLSLRTSRLPLQPPSRSFNLPVSLPVYRNV